MNSAVARKPQENFNVIDRITVKQLDYMRKCGKSYYYENLGVNYKGYEAKVFLRRSIEEMKALLTLYPNVQDVLPKLKTFMEAGYQREWYDSDSAFLEGKSRDFKLLERIVNYIDENGYSIIYADMPIKINAEYGLDYKGYLIKEVAGSVDLVLSKDNERLAVNIMSGEPEYSYRARKETNKVENALPLISTYLGTYYRFGQNVHFSVENWYVKNKEDKGYEIVDKFNHKKGSNVISADFADKTKEQLQDLFVKILNFPEEENGKCDGCIHKKICKMNREPVVEQEVSGASKEVKTEEIQAKPIFTDAQSIVINHKDGPMGVVAVPGAGKTHSLVKRLEKLIQAGVRPENILFVTFTNKAANEIETRVKKTMDMNVKDAKMPTICTFNSLGFNILKENPMYLGRRVKLATDVDRLALINEVISVAPKIDGMSYDGLYSEYGLLRSLNALYNEIDSNGEEAFIQKYAEKKDTTNILITYHMFQQRYKEAGYICFDEQITLVNEIFNKYPILTKHYADRFKYIMLDEFQDSSKEQVDMIYAIARHHNNIVVVGDDDQSIFEWRGGSSRFMLNFEKDFENARIIFMNDNFRSNDRILYAADNVIKQNLKRYQKRFIPHNEAAYKPIYFKGLGSHKIPYLIKQVLSKGYMPGDIAVLARDNKRLVEVYNILNGIVPVSNPKEYLVEDAVFMGIYDVLNLYYNGMGEDESFYRFFAYNNHEKTLGKTDKRKTFYDNLIQNHGFMPVDKSDINCLPYYEKHVNDSVLMREGYRLISCFKAIQYAKSLPEALEKVVYLLFGLTEHPVLDSLNDSASHRAIVRVEDMYNYMTNMILYKADDKVDYSDVRRDKVNLLTAHSSKGKEFRVVIIYATEDFKAEEAEIKLFYVAMTRAKNTLFMVESPYNHCELLKYMREDVVMREAA